MENKKLVRNSGIECLKIAAIILIVVSHVIQTLNDKNTFIQYHDYELDLSRATYSIKKLILSILEYGGSLGNTIFFVCSAWFLLEGKKTNKKKCFFMLMEVWVISVIILCCTWFMYSKSINIKIILRSLFPTTFANNWYITCYLLFYLMHPILNKVIYKLNQRELLRVSSLLLVLYVGFNYLKRDLFFSSALILWVTIYFTVAYIKLYLKELSSSRKSNLIILCVGLIGHIGIILTTNYLGLKIGFFEDKLLFWNSNGSPFLLLIALSLLNIARESNMRNAFINHWSKLAFLIYIIHENLIVRTYFRPYLINYIYQNYGYDYILLWVLLLAIIILIISSILSLLYVQTLHKLVKLISSKLYNYAAKLYSKLEMFILNAT